MLSRFNNDIRQARAQLGKAQSLLSGRVYPIITVSDDNTQKSTFVSAMWPEQIRGHVSVQEKAQHHDKTILNLKF